MDRQTGLQTDKACDNAFHTSVHYRSEAIRGPGRPMDMAAACYAKPKREMIQKNKNFRRRYYTDFC